MRIAGRTEGKAMKARQVPAIGLMLLGLLVSREVQALYNPSPGRWLSRDPLGEAGGLNRYALGWNEAVSTFDLLGLLVEPRPRLPRLPTPPPEPFPLPPTVSPTAPPQIGLPQVGLCIIVAGVSYCFGDALGELTGYHDVAAEGYALMWDTAKCVLCSHRYPTWPKCRKDAPKTTEEAMGAAIGQGRVPIYPGFNGPHLVGCKLEGPAWGCPGMANGGFYECKVAYWSQWSASVAIHYYTVLTCGCCNTFTEGSYGLFRHRGGSDKTSPPKH